MVRAGVCVTLLLLAWQGSALQLFMDPSSDPFQPWGLLSGNPTALIANEDLRRPPTNYSNGDTIFAAFIDLEQSDVYEVFVAVGRPGEPIDASRDPPRPDGVSVQRYTTKDFRNYSAPITVLFLPNDSPSAEVGVGDGDIWTVKSMDRNNDGYLLMAFYGDSATAFHAPLQLKVDCFTATLKGGSFKDHDDTNIIWSRTTKRWVDMQIFGAPWLLPNGSQTICPHNLSDNGGCKGGPRVVTARISTNGRDFSGNLGCSDPSPSDPGSPSERIHCRVYNESGLIRPHRTEDPPELQFYRIRPFYVGDSGRLAAHTLQYAASPAEMNNISSYGYWGPYCPNTNGGFNMCHKGHGYGRMHGPHVMEEWWVSSADQVGPEDVKGWSRPYKRFRAVPHDVWLMSQPVVYNGQHLWVSDTAIYTVPLYRIAGLYAPANGEFSSNSFAMPSTGLEGLWMNVAAKWKGNLVTGGCDEGCAAYVMVELQDEAGRVVAGFERGSCTLMDVDGQQVPLKWVGSPKAPPAGTQARLRFYFRDATIYAIGGIPV